MAFNASAEPTPFDQQEELLAYLTQHAKHGFLDCPMPAVAPRRVRTAPSKKTDEASDTTSCGASVVSSGDEEEPDACAAAPWRPSLTRVVSFSDEPIIDSDKEPEAGASDVDGSDRLGEARNGLAVGDGPGAAPSPTVEFRPEQEQDYGVTEEASGTTGDVPQDEEASDTEGTGRFKVVVRNSFLAVVPDSQPCISRSETAPAGYSASTSESLKIVAPEAPASELTTPKRERWSEIPVTDSSEDLASGNAEAGDTTVPANDAAALNLTATEPVASECDLNEPPAIQHDTPPSHSLDLVEIGAQPVCSSSSSSFSPVPGEKGGAAGGGLLFLSPTEPPSDAGKLESQLTRKFNPDSGECTVTWKVQEKDFKSNKLKVSPEIPVFLDGEPYSFSINLFASNDPSGSNSLSFKQSGGEGYALLKNQSKSEKANISCRFFLGSPDDKEKPAVVKHAVDYDLSAATSDHTKLFNFRSAARGSFVHVNLEILPKPKPKPQAPGPLPLGPQAPRPDVPGHTPLAPVPLYQ